MWVHLGVTRHTLGARGLSMLREAWNRSKLTFAGADWLAAGHKGPRGNDAANTHGTLGAWVSETVGREQHAKKNNGLRP